MECPLTNEFSQLGLNPEQVATLTELGYQLPTPVQVSVIPLMLAGKDVVAQSKTGTGKTAAFALPTLQRLSACAAQRRAGKGAKRRDHRRPIRSLILVPTRELAVQIGASFAAYGKYSGLRQTVVYAVDCVSASARRSSDRGL